MSKIYRAGIIPAIKIENVWHYLFMRPSDPKYGGDFFQIAKGRVDDTDSDFLHTAIREGQEELGLVPSNIRKIYYLGEFFGRTHLYVANVHSRDNFDSYTNETDAVAWMTSTQFMEEGRELHKPVISTLDELCDVQFTF